MLTINLKKISELKFKIDENTYPREKTRNLKIYIKTLEQITKLLGLQQSVLTQAKTILELSFKEKVVSKNDPVKMSLIAIYLSAKLSMLPITLKDIGYAIGEPPTFFRNELKKITEFVELQLPKPSLYALINRYCYDLELIVEVLNFSLAFLPVVKREMLGEGISRSGLAAAIIFLSAGKIGLTISVEDISQRTFIPKVNIQNRIDQISEVFSSNSEDLLSRIYFKFDEQTRETDKVEYLLNFSVPSDKKERIIDIWNKLAIYSLVSNVIVSEIVPTAIKFSNYILESHIFIPELLEEEKLNEINGLLNNFVKERIIKEFEIFIYQNGSISPEESIKEKKQLPGSIIEIIKALENAMNEEVKKFKKNEERKKNSSQRKEIIEENVKTVLHSGNKSVLHEIMDKIETLGKNDPGSVITFIPTIYELYNNSSSEERRYVKKILKQIPYENTYSKEEIFCLLGLNNQIINFLACFNDHSLDDIELKDSSGYSDLKYRNIVKYLLSEGLIEQTWSGFSKSFRIVDIQDLVMKLRDHYYNIPIPIP